MRTVFLDQIKGRFSVFCVHFDQPIITAVDDVGFDIRIAQHRPTSLRGDVRCFRGNDDPSRLIQSM
jgi:hypothetical protein